MYILNNCALLPLSPCCCSVSKSYQTLCNSRDCSIPDFPVPSCPHLEQQQFLSLQSLPPDPNQLTVKLLIGRDQAEFIFNHMCQHVYNVHRLFFVIFLKNACFEYTQFSSVAQSYPTLCDPMNHNIPGLPIHHQLPEFTQTHVHRVRDAIQPFHPLLSPSPAPNPSHHQSLF